MGKEVIGPGRLFDGLDHLLDGVFGRDGEVIANIPLTVSVPGEIDREGQSVEATLLSLGEDLLHQLPVLPNVQLKYLGLFADFTDFRNARGGQRGQSVQRSVMLGGLGSGRLTLPVEHAVTSGGTGEEGKLHIATKDLGPHVDGRFQAGEDVIMHLQLRVGILSSAETDLIVGTSIEIVEDHLLSLTSDRREHEDEAGMLDSIMAVLKRNKMLHYVLTNAFR